jgi:hypothetical protein
MGFQGTSGEQYTEQFCRPAPDVLSTHRINRPFNYGWCTTTEEILRQNFEHIKLKFFSWQQLGRMWYTLFFLPF